MIKVKIVNGSAVEVHRLEAKNKYTALLNRLLRNQFQIVNFDDDDIPVLEGTIYWGWSLGNGRISLIEEIHP